MVYMCESGCVSVRMDVLVLMFTNPSVWTVSNGHWLEGHASVDWQSSSWTSTNLPPWRALRATIRRDAGGYHGLHREFYRYKVIYNWLSVTGVVLFAVNEFWKEIFGENIKNNKRCIDVRGTRMVNVCSGSRTSREVGLYFYYCFACPRQRGVMNPGEQLKQIYPPPGTVEEPSGDQRWPWPPWMKF